MLRPRTKKVQWSDVRRKCKANILRKNPAFYKFQQLIKDKHTSLEQLLCLWALWTFLEEWRSEVETAIDHATLEHNKQFDTARMEDYV